MLLLSSLNCSLLDVNGFNTAIAGLARNSKMTLYSELKVEGAFDVWTRKCTVESSPPRKLLNCLGRNKYDQPMCNTWNVVRRQRWPQPILASMDKYRAVHVYHEAYSGTADTHWFAVYGIFTTVGPKVWISLWFLTLQNVKVQCVSALLEP